MNDNVAALAAQAEGGLRGIASIQRLLEDTTFPGHPPPSLPLGAAVRHLVGERHRAELSAYAEDGAEALRELSRAGHPQAAVALWEVLRCDPSSKDATAASLLTANIGAAIALVGEIGRAA